MKDFIAKSGLTTAQFAKKYNIPYNTVRQWAEGIRKAPEWLIKLFKNEEANKPLIDNEETKMLEYINYLMEKYKNKITIKAEIFEMDYYFEIKNYKENILIEYGNLRNLCSSGYKINSLEQLKNAEKIFTKLAHREKEV